MKMKREQEKICELLDKVIRSEMKRNLRKGPPICVGIFHQPPRP